MTEPEETNHTDEKIGIPENLRLKRRYTLSEKAIEARRKGGIARAKKCPTPNWKHGKYATSFATSMRPCKTSCNKYPCAIIKEGAVEPGEPCLDVAEIVQTAKAIYDAIENKKFDDFNGIANLNIARSLHILKMLQEDVVRDGPTINRKRYDKDGNLISTEYVHHPALNVLPKLIADLAMTPQDFMLTPRAIAKQEDDVEGVKSFAGIMAKLGTAINKQSPVGNPQSAIEEE